MGRDIWSNRLARRILLALAMVVLAVSAFALGASGGGGSGLIAAVAYAILASVSVAALKLAVGNRLTLERELGRVRQANARLGDAHAELVQDVRELRSTLGTERTRLRTLEQQHADADEARRRLDDRAERELAHVRERLSDLTQGLADHAGRTDQTTDRLAGDLVRLSGRTDGIEATAKELGARASEGLQQHSSRLEELATRTSSLAADGEAITHELRAVSGEVAQPRTLTDDTVARLVETWSEPLGLQIDPPRLRYLAHKLYAVESRCRGRLATSMEDVLIRALVTSAIDADDVEVLEIGVLFAINAAYLWEVAGAGYRSFHQSLVDPFEGYYAKDQRDPITGVPVTRTVAEENLRRMGVPPSSVRWLEGLSTDPEILAESTTSSYHLVLIDGDHTYDGVRSDFEHYAPTVAFGGYLIIDDYGSRAWPDVTRFVDDVILGDSRFEKVAIGATTAVFRRHSAADDPGMTP